MAILDLKRARNSLGILLVLILVVNYWFLDRQNAVSAQDPPFDLVLRGGTIADGTGGPLFQGDIGIRAGSIVAVGQVEGDGNVTLDVTGLIVAPGFIDMMGQSATSLMDRPESGLNLLTQGITTINCGEGGSAAPLASEAAERRGWSTMHEYLALLDMQGLPLNVVQTVGHTQIRELVLGDIDRRPGPAELARMEQHVDEAMRAGAIGLSTALIYPPAVYATTEEISALVRVAARHGGGYYTHMRNEGDQLLQAIDEALEIGQMGNSSVHIFHLKAAGLQNWTKMPQAIDRIIAAQADGRKVSADIYPYIHNGLSISALIHPRHFAMGPAAFNIRLDRDTGEFREQIKGEMLNSSGWENWFRHVGFDWNKVILGHTSDPQYRRMTGSSIGQIASEQDDDPWSVFFALVRSGAFVLPESMSETNKKLAMQQPFVAFCTDVGPAGDVDYAAHPRAYGAFSRILGRYVREQNVLSLPEAIRRCTSVAAEHLKIRDRGTLEPGRAADLAVFDATTIIDRSSFVDPRATSLGIQHVIVNGTVVYSDGQFNGQRPGRVIRGPGYQAESQPGMQVNSQTQPRLGAFDQLGREFLQEHAGVGLSIAVTDQGRLVHAAGYGFADLVDRDPVTPQSLFRIASLSKPITAVAVMKLVEQGKLKLDDPVITHLGLEALEPPAEIWQEITIEHLLTHRGGWDRDRSFDAMFRSVEFAKKVGVPPPAGAWDVIHAMRDFPLDFPPGDRYAYSNFGYNLLGRVIENVSQESYESYVQNHILHPLGIRDMRLGKTRLSERLAAEVRYYHPGVGRSVFADDLDQPVAHPYGAWNLEAMDAHGGWLASAVSLAKFVSAFDHPEACSILSPESVRRLWQRPEGAAGYESGQPKVVYYGLGWQCREVGAGRLNRWHTGSLPGTATIMIGRHDGKNFVALLNSRVSPVTQHLGREIDQRLHRAASEVEHWPEYDLFPKF